MGRSTLARRPLAVPVKVCDRVTHEIAPLIPVDVYAVQITRAEEAEARAKGRRSTTPGWRALATRRRSQ